MNSVTLTVGALEASILHQYKSVEISHIVTLGLGLGLGLGLAFGGLGLGLDTCGFVNITAFSRLSIFTGWSSSIRHNFVTIKQGVHSRRTELQYGSVRSAAVNAPLQITEKNGNLA